MVKQKNKMQANSKTISKSKKIGVEIFHKSPKLKPNCRTILERLKTKNRLFLVTAGEKSVQRYKIEVLKLKNYFEKIFFLTTKDVNTFSEVLKIINTPRTKNSVWMVGNSIKYDVIPALKNKINAIWIPADTWEYDRSYYIPKNCIKMEALHKLPEYFEKL